MRLTCMIPLLLSSAALIAADGEIYKLTSKPMFLLDKKSPKPNIKQPAKPKADHAQDNHFERTLQQRAAQQDAAACKLGIPRPATAPAQWDAETRRQARLMSQIMLWRFLRANDENFRPSQANLDESAQLAIEGNAPAAFTLALLREAEGNLTARARYLLRKSLTETLLAYGLDVKAMSIYAATCKIKPLLARELVAADDFPLRRGFSISDVTAMNLSDEQAREWARVQIRLITELNSELDTVVDKASADALALTMADKLLPIAENFLPKAGHGHQIIYQLRKLSDPLGLELIKSYTTLRQDLSKLEKLDFYGSSKFLAIDALLF